MSKATYNRVYLDFKFKMVSICDHFGGAWQKAGRHGTGVVSESLHYDPQEGGRDRERRRQRERYLGRTLAFETSKPAPSDIPPPVRPHILFFPKQFD